MRIPLVLAVNALALLNLGCAGGPSLPDRAGELPEPPVEAMERAPEPTALTDLSGNWSGDTSLWFMPGDPARDSETRATVVSAALGKVLLVTYNWDYEGDPQEGTLSVRTEPHAEDVEVVWYDTWHTGGKFMLFRGDAEGQGLVNVRCSYSAPPGPDWGWRIALTAEGADRFAIRMHNISPDGEEALAVDSRYAREGSSQ